MLLQQITRLGMPFLIAILAIACSDPDHNSQQDEIEFEGERVDYSIVDLVNEINELSIFAEILDQHPNLKEKFNRDAEHYTFLAPVDNFYKNIPDSITETLKSGTEESRNEMIRQVLISEHDRRELGFILREHGADLLEVYKADNGVVAKADTLTLVIHP